MKLIINSVVAILISVIFMGCEETKPPFQVYDITPSDSSNVPKKILLEDFTGHTCGNCPKAGLEAQNLKQVYGDQLVIITVHAGGFAVPELNQNGSYAYDFRTPEGDELISNNFHGAPSGYPTGIINRQLFNSNIFQGYSSWGGLIQGIINEVPDMYIDIENHYDEATRTLSSEIETIWLNNTTGTYNLVAYLIEDSIINWQKFYAPTGIYPPGDYPDYPHSHVLRGSLNGTFGESLLLGDIAAGTYEKKTYNTVLENGWDANQCAVVAFVTDASNFQVLQVEEEHIK